MSAVPILHSQDLPFQIPEPLLRELEEVAQRDHIDPAEVLRKALRMYQLSKMQSRLEQIRATLPATSYTEKEVERLVKEGRQQANGDFAKG